MNDKEKIIVKVDPEIADLIPNFLGNREKDIEDMKEYLDKRDFEKIERLGHSMKGSGAGYGFEGITDVGKFIEIAAKEENIEKIKKGIAKLKDYLERVELTEK